MNRDSIEQDTAAMTGEGTIPLVPGQPVGLTIDIYGPIDPNKPPGPDRTVHEYDEQEIARHAAELNALPPYSADSDEDSSDAGHLVLTFAYHGGNRRVLTVNLGKSLVSATGVGSRRLSSELADEFRGHVAAGRDETPRGF